MKLSILSTPTVLAFSSPSLSFNGSTRTSFRNDRPRLKRQKNTQLLEALTLDTSDQTLSLWVLAFASSHIGLSSIRTNLINSIGDAMDSMNLVDNEGWDLPVWWPGDNTGGNRIFPDSLTAGRQVYRAVYTAISFITLGSSFGAYISSSRNHGNISLEQSTSIYNTCMFISSISFGASIASLFNASPLGLMPSFEGADSDFATTVRRNDALKLTTRGLTRITRHPLILPVAPWGVSTAYLAGGRFCDYILFGGLSMYAIAGCYAQDLRVIREEGSVGTVFQAEARQEEQEEPSEKTQLRAFFADTSFVPFKAVLEGRQSFEDVIREAPLLQFIVGTIVGRLIELQTLQLLETWSV